ncbi:MAG: tRNA pseudouridine(55) synthase TruB [Chlamydiae bacterium]|nr:tRNA pseudouridine(55) synthase TruB [Chlamydiota bacterium]
MIEGILLVNKPRGKTSFNLVSRLRFLSGISKIGHAGTLDPFATGVMVMLVGKKFTKMSDQFLGQDKEYEATVRLGIATDTFDLDGKMVSESDKIPTLSQLLEALTHFQGEILQTPPMFSAKKVQGKKLYELARKGITIERKEVPVKVETTFLSYEYPFVKLRLACSKGTYIRSIADDLGKYLQTGAHLTELTRIRSGPFLLQECVEIFNMEKSDLLSAKFLEGIPC